MSRKCVRFVKALTRLKLPVCLATTYTAKPASIPFENGLRFTSVHSAGQYSHPEQTICMIEPALFWVASLLAMRRRTKMTIGEAYCLRYRRNSAIASCCLERPLIRVTLARSTVLVPCTSSEEGYHGTTGLQSDGS
mmetsp:Transcript_51990/g.70956  ORF Transcript_51990/g.70956 Transcript_51990/m.70956 type:complete len:136 (+) Transcript_51990:2669-3076(+)